LDAVASIAIHNLTLDDIKSKIVFEMAPLPYLLVLSDALQIWNRYAPKRKVYDSTSLKVEFKNKKASCILSVDQTDLDLAKREVDKIESKSFEISILP